MYFSYLPILASPCHFLFETLGLWSSLELVTMLAKFFFYFTKLFLYFPILELRTYSSYTTWYYLGGYFWYLEFISNSQNNPTFWPKPEVINFVFQSTNDYSTWLNFNELLFRLQPHLMLILSWANFLCDFSLHR